MNCFAALFLKFVHSSEEYCEHHEEELAYKKANRISFVTIIIKKNLFYLSILFIFFPQFFICLFVVLFGNFIHFSWFHVFYFSGYMLLFEFCSFSCQVPLLHCFCQIESIYLFYLFFSSIYYLFICCVVW